MGQEGNDLPVCCFWDTIRVDRSTVGAPQHFDERCGGVTHQ